MRGTKKYSHVIDTPDPGKWELAGYEAALPITEKSNPITRELDKADPAQIVQLLKDCDAEIFQEEDEGLVNYKRLYSDSVLKTMIDIIGKVQEVLKEPDNTLIVLSGGGASGRLAFLMAVSFNKLVKGLGQQPQYTYIIAGGDRSLVASHEGPEDSALLGIEDLNKVCEGKKKVIFFGISCGLSASYVAGQLDFCMNNLNTFVPVLVGFNPVTMARNEKIEDFHSTFRQVAERMEKLQESHKAFILNPAVGPEGIAGSSRMKGGSATKVILETLLLTAHKTVSKDSEISKKCLLEILRTYERAHKVTYSHSKKIAALVKQAGTSLQKKAYVYMVGWHTLGIIAIMDGAECIPTFGADINDVRGFLIGDRSEMFNKEADLIAQGPKFAFSEEDFVKTILPSLTELDTVLFLFTVDDDLVEVEKLAVQVKERTSNMQALCHATVGQYLPASLKKLFPSLISIMWPILFLEYEGNFIQRFQRELSTKWILNTVSTGAHVLKGKILRNYMVDLKVSNSKLFGRAVSILQRFTGHSQAKCLEVLLQVIYDPEPLSDAIRAAEVSKHIAVATDKSKVVPTALLCLFRNCSVQEACSRLDAATSVRDALDAALNAPGRKRGASKSDPDENST
ncbi:glucokinase regulatory protein [Eublepharis macularius]|uniref:Glucokinase regulatory protein n=1 Tax=Eublepharis macularius TaxID=481883 RepID=A0AA97JY06_EUBMA|nr:glucokinase regulatory protein [Eublepharis macularius]XP_054845451.1 glucokinase regulatory protein [Eublepharis macularius]